MDDFVKTFQLEETSLRGRVVKLGEALDGIIKAHDYPRPVSHLVAESATLALLLSSMLKYEGIFTLQTKGDGPISMIVADVTSKGEVRACATFDEDRVEKAREQLEALKSTESSQNHLAQYLGKGYIAFTVDQGGNTERYQGIVELKGSSLTDCVQHYFSQSEQIYTGIKMAVGERGEDWRGGGIMLQRMPEEGGTIDVKNKREQEKAMAALARGGFSFDVVQKVMEMEVSEAEEHLYAAL
jgi:molecular chaperone Hsp33